MNGYVNADRTGWTELRVHGVAGTPPESLLQHPQVLRVAGDADAGFYRRRYDSAFVSADSSVQRDEAYFWGGLTAGGAQRALWLLLMPFMLANVAFFALPERPAENQRTRTKNVVRRVVEALQRVFALSITITLMLVCVQVAMDLVGWQCIRSTRDCTADTTWMQFLAWPWLATPGRRLAVTALVPLALVGLLWWLGRSTWLRLEATEVPAPDRVDAVGPAHGVVPASVGNAAKAADSASARRSLTPLEDRRMWNGEEPVRRLRVVHVSAATAVVGVFLVAPLTTSLARIVCVVLLVLLGVTAILASLPSTGRRPLPTAAAPSDRRVDRYTALAAAPVVLVVAGGVLACLADERDFRDEVALPWLIGTMQWLVEGQLALLLITVVLLLMLRRWSPEPPKTQPASDRAGEPVGDQPAWHGLAAAGFMLLALVLAGGFAAGIGIRVADLLGTPTAYGDDDDLFVVPTGYFWVAALTALLAVALLFLVARGWLRLRATAAHVAEVDVPPAYRGTVAGQDVRRTAEIARIWARAQISQTGQSLVGTLLLCVAVGLVAGLILYLIDQQMLQNHARWLVNIGTFLVGAFILLLLYLGRQAYRNPAFRRTVGVVWDLGTFWPRAIHPLAPPCYTERTVPDLMTRLRHLGDPDHGGRVVLSCHSQGAVVGAAAVLQLGADDCTAVALLTYGSPVRRLYTRFFPGYFSVTALNRIGELLVGDTDHNGHRPQWPWRNLHRPSDPIGGPLFVIYPPRTTDDGDNDDIDQQLIDPAFARADGDTCYPPTYGHSNYYADVAFASAVARVRELREAHERRL